MPRPSTGPGEHPSAGGDVGGEDAGRRARFGVTDGAGRAGSVGVSTLPTRVDRPERGVVPDGHWEREGPVLRRDRGIPVRPRRTTVVLSCPTGPDMVRRGTPSPDRTSSPAAGRNRGRPSPVGPEKSLGWDAGGGPTMGGRGNR
ncbi:hypothetical protein CA850_00605 [Micromonospora echinospora]|nr:hypothetical protein CA850_00605 [Micromonospora echinospora]